MKSASVLLLLVVGCVQGMGDENDDAAGERWVDCKVGANEHGYLEVECNMTQDAAPLQKFEATCSEVIKASEEPAAFAEDLIFALIAIVFAGMMSGLTIGLMGFDEKNLAILAIQSTDPLVKKRATRVAALIKDHHLLLVTLLLWNAAAFESLPIFIDRLVPTTAAILISVTFILIFGEIVPQAICTGPRRLQVAAASFYFVAVLMIVSFPIALPFARILDWLLGSREERDSAFMYIEKEALGMNSGGMALVEVHGYTDHKEVDHKTPKKSKGGRQAVNTNDDDDELGLVDADSNA